MTRDEWVKIAADELRQLMGNDSESYAQGLYDSYVMDDVGFEDDPKSAVTEYLSYCGDSE